MILTSSMMKFAHNFNPAFQLIKTIQINKLSHMKFPRSVSGVSLKAKSDLIQENKVVKENLIWSDIFSQNKGIDIRLNLHEFSSCKAKTFYSPIVQVPLSIMKNIIEPESYKKSEIIPPGNVLNNIELPCSGSLEKVDPLEIVEKQAVNMLIIRRKKMKRHKRKKRFKKFKILYAKLRLRKKLKREEAFQNELKEIVAKEEKYSAEKEFENNLQKLNWQRPVTRVRGILAPQWVIKEYLNEKQYNKTINARIAICEKKLFKT